MEIMDTNLTDEELLSRCNHSEIALETMLRRYSRLVTACARAYYLVGGDESDLIQEGMLGLLSAIRSYEASSGVQFPAYARICIRRRMISAVRADSAEKNGVLNGSVSLHSISPNLKSDALLPDPETLYLGKERSIDLLEALQAQLSPYERRVLPLFLDGCSAEEIAAAFGRTKHSAENAIQRIRIKARSLFSGENGNADRIY